MKNYKNFLIIIVLLFIIVLPMFETSYHIDGVGEIVKKVSIVNIVIEDFQNGTLGTLLNFK